MKKITVLICTLQISSLFGQGVLISDQSAVQTPDPAAILELESTTKGFLPPRLTTVQRDGLPQPIPVGLRIFNLDSGCENFYNGNSWRQICGECDFAAPFASSNSPVCSGSSIDLAATSIPGATYSWTGPAGFSSSDQNPILTNVAAENAGLYSVVATKNGCSSPPSYTTVSVSSAPENPIASNLGPVCVGYIVSFFSSGTSAFSYNWNGPNGFVSNQQNFTLPTSSLSDAGIYTVTVSSPGCSSVQSSTSLSLHTVPGTPTALIADAGNGQASLVFSAPSSGGSPITGYTITVIPGYTTVFTNNPSVIINGLTNGTAYSFTVVAHNECGTSIQSAPSNTVTPNVPSGCSSSAAYAYKIADDLWLCAPDNITGNNNFMELATACNNSANFFLATVGPMTRRGLPTQGQISGPMASAHAAGFDFATTGHPTRFFQWNRSITPYETTSCGSGGTGYIYTQENISGSNWLALVDGNENHLRDWPAANCTEVSYHTLISLCQDASADPVSYVYDYRWR